jgi:tetratricopeptide (TPR) repeat protein
MPNRKAQASSAVPAATPVPSNTSKDRSIQEHFTRPGLLLTVLGVLTLIVYDVSLSFHFAWDDIFQIVDNPLVRSWRNVPRAFMSDLWFQMDRGQLYYRPLFTTWSIFNYSVFQLKPWGWHLTAILLHVATVCVFFAFARRLGVAYWTAAAAAAIFALHPIHIETVSWISAASDTMVALFYMAAFIAFLKTRTPMEPRRLLWRILSLGFLACALLTKEMAVTFGLVVALYVWIFRCETGGFSQKAREAVIAALPYGMVTLLYLLMRKYALHSVVLPPAEAYTTLQVLVTLPYVLAFYLWKFLFPVGLTGLYYTPYLNSAASPQFLVSLIALAAFAFTIWYWQRRKNDPTVAFLGLWTVITIIPALYLPNFSNSGFVRDRYAYMSSIGLVLLVAKGIVLLPSLGKTSVKTVQVTAVVLICLAYVIGDSQQIYWDTDLTIFRRGVALYPNSGYAEVGLARVLQRVPGEEDHAINLLKEAVAQSPGNRTAYYLLAEAYSRKGNRTEGRAALEKGLALTKNTSGAEIETADLAGIYGRLGDYDRALSLCSEVLTKSPDLVSALYNCGNVSFEAGQYAEGEKLLTRAVEQDPGEAGPLFWLGRVHFEMGRFSEAERDFRRAIAIQSEAHEYHYWLGMTLEKQGDTVGARGQYKEALRLEPLDQTARQRLNTLQ